MTPELQKDLDAVSIALVRPMALEGLPVERATAEFREETPGNGGAMTTTDDLFTAAPAASG